MKHLLNNLAHAPAVTHVATHVQSNADKITDFALNKVNGLISAAAAVLPKATAYTLQTVSMQCLIDVLQWVTGLVIVCVSAAIAGWVFKKGIKVFENRRDRYDDGFLGLCIPSAIVLVLDGIGFLICICCVPYWSFIGISHPDLYLIHLAVQKLLG